METAALKIRFFEALCASIDVASDTIEAAFVTGSRVWGTADAQSDWDVILVLAAEAEVSPLLLPPDVGFALLERCIPWETPHPLECNIELMRHSHFWNELICDKANLQAISCLYLPPACVLRASPFPWKDLFEAHHCEPWRIVRATLWKAPSSFNRGRYYFRHAEALLAAAQDAMPMDDQTPVEIRGWTAARLIRRGKKMMSHAFRYILFAHQLLRDGKLSDLHAGADIWTSLSADSHTSWQYYEDKYRPQYKKLLDEMPVSAEDKVAPADAETLALPPKYHRLLYLVRLPKQQDSYLSGINSELVELARHALADSARHQLSSDIQQLFPMCVDALESAFDKLEGLITRFGQLHASVVADCEAKLSPDYEEQALRRLLNESTKSFDGADAFLARGILSMQRLKLTATAYVGTCSPKELQQALQALD